MNEEDMRFPEWTTSRGGVRWLDAWSMRPYRHSDNGQWEQVVETNRTDWSRDAAGRWGSTTTMTLPILDVRSMVACYHNPVTEEVRMLGATEPVGSDKHCFLMTKDDEGVQVRQFPSPKTCDRALLEQAANWYAEGFDDLGAVEVRADNGNFADERWADTVFLKAAMRLLGRRGGA